MVYEYSGDFIKRVDCDGLQNTKHVNRVVFYGDDAELAKGGRLSEFAEAATVYKYTYNDKGDQGLVFYHNDDPECHLKYDIQWNE